MTIDEILNRIEEICRQMNVGHLYLFGSYAAGDYTNMSDIDIYVKECKDMTVLREKLEQIPTLKKIDLINYDSCKNKFLIEEMDKYGKQIY